MTKWLPAILIFSWITANAQVDLTLLRDFTTGTTPPNVPDIGIAALNEKTIFFRRDNNAEGIQIWVTMGTEASTSKIFTIGDNVGTVFNTHSLPKNFTVVGNRLYFTTGLDLYVTDGTASGTSWVYSAIGEMSWLSNLNGNLIFHVGLHPNSKLWRSDGTTVGTYMLGPGTGPSAVFNGNVYFSNPGTGGGLELWKSNGTSGGQLLKEIMPGASGSNPDNFFVSSSRLFFQAADDTHGRELWQTDGLEAGTTLVKEITPGLAGSIIQNMVDFNGTLFFVKHSLLSPEIWKSDGTEANTIAVETFTSDDVLTNLRVADGKVFFLKDNSGTPGEELWVTNGAPSNAHMVAQLSSEPDGSTNLNGRIIKLGSQVQFIINDGADREIWRSDGTSTGTNPYVTDLDLSLQGVGDMKGLTAMGDRFAFLYDDEGNNLNVWLSDGTAAGTRRVSDFDAYPASTTFVLGFTRFNGYQYFMVDDGIHGIELWRTNGVETELFLDCNSGTASGFGFATSSMMVAGNLLFFFADDGIHGPELWKTDGTPVGTSMVKEIYPGSSDNGDYFGFLGTFQNSLVFKTHDGVNGIEPWISNGTEAGTVMLMDATPGPSSSSLTMPSGLLNDQFLFSSTNTITTLWKSDGTPAGTEFLQNLTMPGSMHVLNNTFLFARNESGSVTANELYGGDGTAAGTQLLKQFPIAPNEYSTIFGFTEFKGYIYFTAKDATSGYAVWRTDGTAAGTTMYLDPNPGYLYYGGPFTYQVVGDKLFIASVHIPGTTASEIEVWVTEGTGPSTKLTVFPYSDLIYSGPWFSFKDKFIFQGHDPAHGVELWKSDGTVAGTQLLQDINEGPASSFSKSVVANENDFYFTALGNGVNPQVWKSDGTMCRTQQMTREPGFIYNIAPIDDSRMLVVENHPQVGVEIFLYNKSAELPFQCNQEITFDPVDKPLADGSATLTATASSGLPVTLTSNNAVVSVTGTTATFQSAGRASIRATQAGDAYYGSVTIDKEFCVNPGKPSVTAEYDQQGNILLKSSAPEGNEWYFNGTPLGATGSEVTATAAGDYHVIVAIDGCESPVSETITLPDDVVMTAITEKDKRGYFPNPVTDRLVITGADNRPFELYSVTGQLSMAGIVSKDKGLDLRGIQPGLYLVVIVFENELWTFKIAKR